MTQATDGDVNGAIERITIHTAQLLQNLVTIQHFPGIPGQQHQGRKLIGCQVNRMPIQQGNALIQIDGQPVKRQGLTIAEWLGATQNRLNPSHQFTGFKGLGQVIIGPQLQPNHLIRDFPPGGQHDNWSVAGLANSPADFKTVHIRQHDIQNHQIGGRLLQFF